MSACLVCGYHSGPVSDRQRLCMRVHVSRPVPEPFRIEPEPIRRDEEVPSSAYSEEGPDAAPLNLCPYCVGGVAGGDVCERCWGSGKGE